MIRLAETLLIDGGYFIAVCPNGSLPYRIKDPQGFHHSWGKVHPNYLNGEFYKHVFQNRPYYIGSSPVNSENIHPLQKGESLVDDLSGDELLVIVKFDKD
jgi:hypothetical protein